MWSNAPAPRRPTSSFCVNSSSTPACGLRSETIRRAASTIATTADLLSAPRIVPAAFRTIPSVDDGLERPLRRHGVEVRAEKDRRPAVEPSRQPAQQVARVGVDTGAGVVLLDLEAEGAQLGGDAIGDRALIPRWTGDRAELCEEIERRRHVG